MLLITCQVTGQVLYLNSKRLKFFVAVSRQDNPLSSSVRSSHRFHGRWDDNGEFCGALTLSDSYKNETKNEVKTVLHEIIKLQYSFYQVKVLKGVRIRKEGANNFLTMVIAEFR